MRRIIATLAAMIMLGLAAAAPALAQQQEGLVNVVIGDVTVQVPVAVAANICDVNVNIIARQFAGTDRTVCEADADAMAEVPPQFRP